MIKPLTDVPAGVIGFEVTDKVTAEDYRDVVIPAIENAAKTGDLRFVAEIPEFKGMTPSAVWEDLKVGVDAFRKWKKIALVTDIEWMTHMTHLFGWMTPGEVKTFTLKERDQAMTWVSS